MSARGRAFLDELAAGAVALALAAGSILLATSEVRADPVVVKAELVLYPSAVEVVRECLARNGNPPPGGLRRAALVFPGQRGVLHHHRHATG